MKSVVFIGLTIQASEAVNYNDCIFLSPIKAGDIPSVVSIYKPATIGIVDGFFHNTASVLHKDILFALNKGIKVIGAGSIGALRAVELQSYGMFGSGQIFSDYLSGEITGDDEVAVPSVFVPSLSQFIVPPNFDALVNIRYTLNHAKSKGIIDSDFVDICLIYLKKLCFLDRCWNKIFENDLGLNLEMLKNFREQFNELYINQKKLDAIELIKSIYEITNPNKIVNSPFVSGPIWSESIWSRPLSLENVNDFLLQDVIDISFLLDDTVAIYYKSLLYKSLKIIYNANKNKFTSLLKSISDVPFIDMSEISPLFFDEVVEIVDSDSNFIFDFYKNQIEVGYILTEFFENNNLLLDFTDFFKNKNLSDFTLNCNFNKYRFFFDAMLRTLLIKLGEIIGIQPSDEEVENAQDFIKSSLKINHNSIDCNLFFSISKNIVLCEQILDNLLFSLNDAVLKELIISNKYFTYKNLLLNIVNKVCLNAENNPKELLKQYFNTDDFDNFYESYLIWIPIHRLQRCCNILKMIK